MLKKTLHSTMSAEELELAELQEALALSLSAAVVRETSDENIQRAIEESLLYQEREQREREQRLMAEREQREREQREREQREREQREGARVDDDDDPQLLAALAASAAMRGLELSQMTLPQKWSFGCGT